MWTMFTSKQMKLEFLLYTMGLDSITLIGQESDSNRIAIRKIGQYMTVSWGGKVQIVAEVKI